MRPRWTLVFSRMCSPPRTPSKISRVWRTARSKLRSAPARAAFACSRIGAPCGRRRASSGARVIRVCSYWRSVRPEGCFERVARALEQLAGQAALHGRTIGLENEHACNIATGAETARVLEAVAHPNLKVVWDPANAYVSGETPYPDGYRRLPVERIAHVHAKDCRVEGHRPMWCALGEGGIDWKDQIRALAADGYKGWISLETHWTGPGGDKHEASVICGRNLMALATGNGTHLFGEE